MKYKSNRKNVVNQMRKANETTLNAVGLAAKGMVKAETPVGRYPEGSGRTGGSLRGSIDYSVDEDGVSVGSTLTSEDYPIFVHEGTRYMAANPYIKNGIMHNMLSLRSIAERNYKL